MLGDSVQFIHFYCCKKSVEDIDRKNCILNGFPVHVSVKLTLSHVQCVVCGMSHSNAVNQPSQRVHSKNAQEDSVDSEIFDLYWAGTKRCVFNAKNK